MLETNSLSVRPGHLANPSKSGRSQTLHVKVTPLHEGPMTLPTEPRYDESDGVQMNRPWRPLPGATSDPSESLCWVWLKVLAVGFLLALAIGLIGLGLDILCV